MWRWKSLQWESLWKIALVLNQERADGNSGTCPRWSLPISRRGYNMIALQQYATDILQIATKHGVIKVRVFGSFATGTATPSSDIDLLVNLETGRDLFDLIALKQELETQIGRKVDVVTEKGLSPHLRETIIRQSRPLWKMILSICITLLMRSLILTKMGSPLSCTDHYIL